MLSQVRAIAFAQLFASINVFSFISHVENEPRDLLWITTSLIDDFDHIPERPIELSDEEPAIETLLIATTVVSELGVIGPVVTTALRFPSMKAIPSFPRDRIFVTFEAGKVLPPKE